MNTELTLPAPHVLKADWIDQQLPWYGIRTRSNQERMVVTGLEGRGYKPYLPLYLPHARRNNVLTKSEFPLFPGYVFCRFDVKKRLPVLTTSGVVSVIGCGRKPVPIPDDEIEAVERYSDLACQPKSVLTWLKANAFV